MDFRCGTFPSSSTSLRRGTDMSCVPHLPAVEVPETIGRRLPTVPDRFQQAPSTRKNGSMVHPKNIPWIFKQTLPGIFHKLLAILTFEFWNLSLSFGISLNETNKGCWDYTKNNPHDFPWRSYFSVLASSSSPLELLEQCCAKARVRWQCQDIPPRGNLSQIRKNHSLRWRLPKMVVQNNNHGFSY